MPELSTLTLEDISDTVGNNAMPNLEELLNVLNETRSELNRMKTMLGTAAD